jgi:hypothetical protein
VFPGRVPAHWGWEFSVLLHWLYGPCRTLASFRINFQASLSLAIFFQPRNTHFLQIIFSIVRPSHSWLSNRPFFLPPVMLNTLLHSYLFWHSYHMRGWEFKDSVIYGFYQWQKTENNVTLWPFLLVSSWFHFCEVYSLYLMFMFIQVSRLQQDNSMLCLIYLIVCTLWLHDSHPMCEERKQEACLV